jgi:exodeoxyribonuclease VII large subunit
VYFSLKDAGAQLSAVMFRGDAARQDVKLRDGVQVLVYGEISVYEARGNYQLIVRAVIEDGVGRLQREFEALKRRLAEEGLFAAENKIAIPPMPRTVGVITSPTGAAVQDFVRILIRRGWRGQVVVLPAKVQGEGAAAELVEMLRVACDPAECGVVFDLLVIGRGGGSLEDLWAFNEEPLVRAVAACPLPIISAVGHEIDFTLCDFAADVRVETPSAAAELISSGFVSAAERVERAAEDLNHHVGTALEAAGERLDHLEALARDDEDDVNRVQGRAAAVAVGSLQPALQRPQQGAGVAVALAFLAVRGAVDDGPQRLGHRLGQGPWQAHDLTPLRR